LHISALHVSKSVSHFIQSSSIAPSLSFPPPHCLYLWTYPRPHPSLYLIRFIRNYTYIRLYSHIHTYIHLYSHLYTPVFAYVYANKRLYPPSFTHIHLYPPTPTHIHLYLPIFTHVYTYIRLYPPMFTPISAYIRRQACGTCRPRTTGRWPSARPTARCPSRVRVTSELSPSHVRVMSESCPSRYPSHQSCPCISESYPSHIRVISESYPSHIRVISESYPSHIRVISESYPSHVRDGTSSQYRPRQRSLHGPRPIIRVASSPCSNGSAATSTP
jgi:hypothetical protein